MIFLISSVILAAATPEIAVVVLPLESEEGHKKLSNEMTEMLREVLLEIQGIDCQDCKARGKAVRRKMERILKRCGKEPDCRVKVGSLLGAQLLVMGKVSPMGHGLVLDLELLDVGSGKLKGKVSRTLSGSRVRKAASLEAMLTEILFPERIIGSLDLFLDPPGGTIYLDGRPKIKKAGPQVHLKDIPAGQHAVRVEKPGFVDFYAIVQIPYQSTTKLEVNMRPGTSSAETKLETGKKDTEGGEAWYEKWWVWTIVGAVVVGGTITAVALAQ